MVQGPISRLCALGLILLLGVQLTGLSCLNEWAMVSSAGNLVVHGQVSGPAAETGQSGDDGCPCHLAFMSVLSKTFQVSCPVDLIGPDAPAAYAPAHPSLPFHPPLTL